MPTLDWIGKKAVVNHHREVPYRLIHCEKDKSVGDPDAGNLLVQGDNLDALKALLPYYAGKVKCIYIDPPYNTGKDDWSYSDRVDDPQIVSWLNRAVGAEAEDLSRHDKWLCMMYPRLRLMREYLCADGIMLISVDQNEFAAMKLVMDELFSRRNWIGEIVWKNVTDNNPSRITIEHEYILCYARDASKLNSAWKSPRSQVKELIEARAAELIDESGDDLSKLKRLYAKWFKENKESLWPFQEYDEVDFGGVFTESRSVHNPGKEGYFWELDHPETGRPVKKPLMGYRFPEETRDELISDGLIVFGKDETQLIRIKIPISNYKSKLPSVIEFDGRRGSNEIREIIFESKRAFNNPKPSDLILDLLSYVTSREDIILDAFGGSGTTAHGTLKLNQLLGGNRRFIIVEMMQDVAQTVTAKRLQRAIEGYHRHKRDGSKEAVSGLGSGFRFCTLGEPLFSADGNVSPEVTFPDLAAHVFFCETGSPIPRRAEGSSPLIGTFQDRAIYLLHASGSMGVANEKAGNVLTSAVLDSLPLPSPDLTGMRVVYAEGCTLPDDRLNAAGVTFKQVPYQIEGL